MLWLLRSLQRSTRTLKCELIGRARSLHVNRIRIRPSKCYRNEENDGFVKSWQKYDNDNVNVIFLWTERGATVSFCMTEYKLMTCYCYFFFDSDKAIGLPWCNIGHFHCYCYIFFDWEDGNVTIFLTNFMLLWHYFGQFTTIVTIFLDTRSAIVTNVGHFYCYCYFFFDGVDGNVTLFLTKFMLLWHYFGQFTTNVTYFLTQEVLSWHTWDIRVWPGPANPFGTRRVRCDFRVLPSSGRVRVEGSSDITRKF